MFCAKPYPTRSRTLSSPPPTLRGRVRLHVGYLGIPTIFQLVCHTFLWITFAFSCHSRSMEARNYRSDRRETGTRNSSNRKTENRIEFQIRKPVNIFRENRKPNAKIRKIRKPQWTPKPKNRSFLAQKPKAILKIAKTAKIENPNAPLLQDRTSI